MPDSKTEAELAVMVRWLRAMQRAEGEIDDEDENEEMASIKVLNDDVLEVGDIVLTTATGKISKTIRTATASDISHAMLLVQSSSLVDSTQEGVHARSTQRIPFEHDAAVHVLRLRRPLKSLERDQIVQYARNQIAEAYSTREAIQSVTGPKRSASKYQFCSRLVGRAYASAGIQLTENPDFCSPGDLQRSKLLIEVPNATRPSPAWEVEAVAQIPDTTAEMRRVTNVLVEEVRKLVPEIGKVDDITTYLRTHPHLDADFDAILKASGYLGVWQFEKNKNPWQYELELMQSFEMPAVVKTSYCRKLDAEAEDSLQRLEVNRAAYTMLVEESGLKTFRTYLDLYETLVRLHLQRVRVASTWLQTHAPQFSANPPPPPLLIPHSDEWFAALKLQNPVQEEITRTIVGSAGRVDVCSVCGDDPAKDYRMVGRELLTLAVSTLRLCDDCWEIRRAMFAECPGLI